MIEVEVIDIVAPDIQTVMAAHVVSVQPRMFVAAYVVVRGMI